MNEDIVTNYRKLVGGGSICLVRDGLKNAWVWRYQAGPRVIADNRDLHSDSCSTIEEFVVKMGRTIDYEDYVDTLPIPRRREAVMATREKM